MPRLGRRQARHRDAPSLWCGRRDQPLQLPLNLVAHKMGPALAARQFCCAEARRPDSDLGSEAGRGPGRSRVSRRLAQRGPGPRARWATRSSSTAHPRHLASPDPPPSAGASTSPRPPNKGKPRAGLQAPLIVKRRRRLGRPPPTRPSFTPSRTLGRAASRSSASSCTRRSPMTSPNA